jgi:hypothetical protein
LVAVQQDTLLAWRVRDGALIALEDCPAPPGAVRFGADGRFLATSNTGAVICWRFDPQAKALEPIVCGIASRVPASAVACHPGRAVIAAGYQNGAVMLCQPHSKDVLFVREAGGEAVNALAWSSDGGALGYGTQAGEIGVVVLPDQMFRSHVADTASPEPVR